MPVSTDSIRDTLSTTFPDNVSGEISAADMRSSMTLVADVIDEVVDAETSTRAAADVVLTDALAALAIESDSLADDLTAIETDLATKASRALVVAQADTVLPGFAPDLYSSGVTGSPAAATPIYNGSAFVTGYNVADVAAYGRVARMTNIAGYLSPVAAIPIRPGRVYALRGRVARVVDPAAPSTDTVDIGLQELNHLFSGSGLTNRLSQAVALTVAMGATEFTEKTYSLNVPGVDVTLAAGTVSAKPWVRTKGTAQATDAIELSLEDVTEVWLLERLSGDPAAAASPDALVSRWPGQAPALFSAGITSTPANRTPVYDGAAYQTGFSRAQIAGYGRALRMTGLNAVYLAPRATVKFLPGSVYRVTAVVKRVVDPSAPDTDKVDIGVVGLTSIYAVALSDVIESLPLTIADGLVKVTGTVSIDVSGVDITLPPTAVEGRPWVRTNGTGQTTDAIGLWIEDITAEWALQQQIDALGSGVEVTATAPKGAMLGNLLGKVALGRDTTTARAVTLATMGDSIAFGMGTTAILGGLSAGTVVYSGQTAAAMDVDFEGWSVGYPDVSFVGQNLALAGTHTREGALRYLADYPQTAPDVIFYHDWVNGRGPLTDAEYEWELRRILQMIRATTDADIILSSPVPFMVVHTSAAAYYAEDRFATIRRLATEFGCELIDWWAEFAAYRKLHPEVPLANGIMSADNIHPSAFGYNLMRSIVHNRLVNPNGQDHLSPSAVRRQGEPPKVLRFGEIAALGMQADVTIPATWAAVNDDAASGNFALQTSGTDAISLPFEGNRLRLRVLGQTGGGVLTFGIDGGAVTALNLRRCTTPAPNPGNWVFGYEPSGGGETRHRPWRVEVKGAVPAQTFTLTFTSDTDYTVSGSVTGALAGSGSVGADSTFAVGAGSITIREHYWTRPLTSETVPQAPYRSGDLFTFTVSAIGTGSVDTAALAAGWHLIEIAYRLPAGPHTLTITGDGDPVAVDLLIIDGA